MLLTVMMAFGLVACKEQKSNNGDMKSKVDQAVDAAHQKMETIQDKATPMMEQTKEKADQALETVDKKVHETKDAMTDGSAKDETKSMTDESMKKEDSSNK